MKTYQEMAEQGKGTGIVETEYLTFAHPPDELVLESGERLGQITHSNPPCPLGRCTCSRLSRKRGKTRMVGCHDRAGEGIRYREIFRYLFQCTGGLQGFNRSVLHKSEDE